MRNKNTSNAEGAEDTATENTFAQLSADSDEESVTEDSVTVEQANALPLKDEWILWAHEVRNNDWTIDGYKNIATLRTVGDVLHITNNFHKLDLRKYHYYVMRLGINPTWEDPANRKGGVCSFRAEITPMTQHKSLAVVPVWNYLMKKILGETLLDSMVDINGLSISPKNNWAIVKIWNRNSYYDLSKTLPDDVRERLGSLSIKYKANTPEY